MIVFNVGGALCVLLRIGDITIISDVGKSRDFNPITDFLVPLYENQNAPKGKSNKYLIDQLIISHPHEDHISALKDFDQFFDVKLLTCPNDKLSPYYPDDTLDLSQFDTSSENVKLLKRLYTPRQLPLQTILNDTSVDRQLLYYLHPKKVAASEELTTENECYCNNVSLVSLFVINGHRVLLPGDIMKNGMRKLLQENSSLSSELSRHYLSILIAPHHGLKSSFSTDLFDSIKGNKVKCLNIISEKENNPDDSRVVDSRYSSKDYCMGDNNLESTNGELKCYRRKTSQGHICVDFMDGRRPEIQIIQDTNDLLDWFVS